MTKENDDIVFEDLRGVPDNQETVVQVDLDAEDPTISRHARILPADDDDAGSDKGRKDRSGDGASDDDQDGDRGDDGYGKNVRARIKREQRVSRRERDRADEAEARADAAERQLAKQKKAGRKTDTDDLDRQITSIETDLEEAFENGSSKDQARLTSKLTDLRTRRVAADYGPPDDGDDDLDDEPARRPKRNEALEDWIGEQDSWFQRKGFERETRVANRIDKEVHEDGFDPRDPEYFEEMNKRLKEKFPELYDDADADGDGDGDGNQERLNRRQRSSANAGKRSPVAGADDGAETHTGSRDTSKIDLGPDDFANMRRFNLDENDPAVLKEYALNKRQSMLEEEAS